MENLAQLHVHVVFCSGEFHFSQDVDGYDGIDGLFLNKS